MYQINTYAPLAASKDYFPTKKECFDHLREVIRVTNEFLQKERKPIVIEKDLDWTGVSILMINEEVEPTVMKMLGRNRRISLHNINGSKAPPSDYADLFAVDKNEIRTKKIN